MEIVADVLIAIAKAIGKEIIKLLGHHLDFDPPTVEMYMAENTCPENKGTVRMLQDWQKKTKPEHQAPVLRTALQKVGMHHVAEKHLPDS